MAIFKPPPFSFLFMPSRPQPAGGIERSSCVYVRTSIDHVKIFVQGRISRPINGSKLIFHMRVCISMKPAGIYKTHNLYFTVHWLQTLAILSRLRFLSNMVSRLVNGSKLIFHMMMYLYETSRNIQEPWPPDLYFMVHWLLDFGLINKIKISVQGRISRPINASKLIFHMRMYLYETSRNIQEPWPPDLYFTVCWLQT